jgi:hypothetical protein
MKEKQIMSKEAATQAKEKPQATHEMPTDLNREGVTEITTALRPLLADAFALYLKTKNFHWHMTGHWKYVIDNVIVYRERYVEVSFDKVSSEHLARNETITKAVISVM